MTIDIEFLGHAGLLITGSEGVLAIDPFLTGNPVAVKKPGEVKCTHIALTHGHDDHIGDALALSKANNAPVIAAFEICNFLGELGARTEPANPGGRVATDFGWIALTQAFHSSSHAGKYMGQPCGIVAHFTEEDFTLYHLGDTALFGDLALIGELYRPDVACIPVGDRFTMGPEHGKRAAEMIRPKVAIPIHWGTWPALAQDISAFKPEGVEVRVMKPGERFRGR